MKFSYLFCGVGKIKKFFFKAALVLFSFPALAGEYTGKVKAMYVDQYGRVLLNIDGPGQPNCHQALWQFNFNLSGTSAKEWFSMLLATRAMGTSIRLGYVDNPAGECTVVYFYFLD